jgi:hypothetical protein
MKLDIRIDKNEQFTHSAIFGITSSTYKPLIIEDYYSTLIIIKR